MVQITSTNQSKDLPSSQSDPKVARKEIRSSSSANVHFHHLTAKKEQGFAKAHAQFWQCLAENITRYQVRLLAGDFNMALWCVVPELRRRGIRVDIAAWFPWRCTSEGVFEDVVKCDSEAVFVIGGARSIKLRSSAFALGLESAPAYKEQVPASFFAGQGYPLHSYLPKKSQEQAVRETLSLSAAVVATGPPLLPPCREKRGKPEVFDPNGNLFTMGVHMPLMAFFGDHPRRTAEALERRENKARSRGKHFGKGKGKGKGKEKGKGKGKPAVAGPSQGGKSSSSVVDA